MPKAKAKKKRRRLPEFSLIDALTDESYDPLTMNDDIPAFPKVSRALYDFMRPYAPDDFTEVQWKRLVIMSMVAWNAALYPQHNREAFIDGVIRKEIPSGEQSDARLIIDDLMYRKEKFFGEYQQMIQECEIVRNSEGTWIQVVSIPR